MMNLEDDSSPYSSSSSSLFSNITKNPSSSSKPTNVPHPTSHKRKVGRKKFRETRHPVYNGVRLKSCDKWVCEVREPKKKSRIWLGTFPNPEMAARAYDVAALALYSEMAKLNFPDSATLLPRAKSSSARDIQMAVLEATRAVQLTIPSPSSSPSSSLLSSRRTSLTNHTSPRLTSIPRVKYQKNLLKPAVVPEDYSVVSVRDSKNVLDSSETGFVDEEALFNMPGLLDSMAEGLLLTPPAMKRGFSWDAMDCDMDMTLWRY
ncbi:Dehydration-responsive element-binding protein like [Actinidia chinensis var. chinensis]|uniref:Dehydration-responsive element-binding protein like n=1 Tax=Actinidia chinensis var. chinensis TaxID=1590841 RepID=A0A2R6Q789_ACTCC|nr:Dehydration-responsive element-binding protein like [Actinidia chinensis var. chinensis]